jgi:hypothetical protein
MSRTIVPIINPVAGGARYTSLKRAQHFVRAGRAELTSANELFFYDAATVIARREQARLDSALATYRGGVVLWNGSVKDRPNRPAIHGPGEVRS